MSGSLWLRVPGGDTLPTIPRPRHTGPGDPGPAGDPMEELADRLGPFIAAAVHPDEIAAILESDGMTDEHIRLTYGRHDSFGLAEELYARVPRAFPEPEHVPDPWKVSLTACLLRGVIFALPGLAYVLGAPLLEGPQDRLGLPSRHADPARRGAHRLGVGPDPVPPRLLLDGPGRPGRRRADPARRGPHAAPCSAWQPL